MSSGIITAVKTLREKYDGLRKGMESIITDHTNSTNGLDNDEIIERLIHLLKKDNELKI